MLSEHLFARGETAPSWWANALDAFLSVGSFQFALTQPDSTHVQVVAGANDQAAAVSIGGFWRWNESTISRVHPGGGAGAFDVFVTASAESIVAVPAPYTDTTNRAFNLAIVPSGSTPTIVLGTVDIFRKVGSLSWDGVGIVSLTQTVGLIAAPSLPWVFALPTSPTHGQECLFVVDRTNAVYWRVRYNATSSSAYKWEAVGLQMPLRVEQGGADTLASAAAWTDQPTPVQITLPTSVFAGGDFRIVHEAGMQPSLTAGDNLDIAVTTGGVLAVDTQMVAQTPVTSGIAMRMPGYKSARVNALAAGTVIKQQYQAHVTTGLPVASGRVLEVSPYRIG